MYLPINSENPNINFVTCILCYSKYEFSDTMNTLWAHKLVLDLTRKGYGLLD